MSRRQSLADRLNGLANNMEDDFTLEMLEEVFVVAKEGEGFRYTAPTTQKRQDLHLRELLRFARATQMLGDEFSDEDVKQSLFSASAEDVIRMMKGYFVIAMKFCTPRSTKDRYLFSSDTFDQRFNPRLKLILRFSRPRYQTLIQRRFSMLFWLKREMQDRAPTRAKFINATNSILQYAGRKYGVNKVVADKVYLGRRELEQLLEGK